MGRGDKKTKKGKRFASSYGKVRIRKEDTEKFVEKPKIVKTESVTEKKVETKKKTTSKKKTVTKKKTTKKV